MASELSQFIEKELKSHGVENDDEEQLLADLRMKPLTVESSQPPGFLKRYRNVFLLLGGVIVIALILIGSGSYYATTRNTDLSKGSGADVKKMPPLEEGDKKTKEMERREYEDDDEYDDEDEYEDEYEKSKEDTEDYMHGDGVQEKDVDDEEYDYSEAPEKGKKESGKDEAKAKDEKKEKEDDKKEEKDDEKEEKDDEKEEKKEAKVEKKKDDEEYEDYDYSPDTPTPQKE